MGATTTLSGFPEALKKDSYKWYWESSDPLPKVYSEVFEVRKSNALYEKSTSAVGTGLLIEKPENKAMEEKSPIEGYTVYGRNIAWGKIEHISKELHDDTQKLAKFLESQMPMWSKDAVETMETFYANVFNYGGYTAGHSMFNASISGVLDDPSGDKIYDSVPLITPTGTNHIPKSGGTGYYNGLGALNITKDNLQTAWNLFTVTNNRKEDGSRMSIAPDILLASPALKFTIDELINSPDDPTTPNRAINVLKNIVRPVYWHYLTDADQWTLVKAKFGLVALMRENPEFDMWEVKETKNYKMSIFMRFGLMIENWRGVVSANYATS